MKQDINILGIHQSGAISSAALVVNGKVVSGTAQERISRIKHDKSFPHDAIASLLKEQNITWSDLDSIAIGWNPGENAAKKYREGFSHWMRYPGEWLSSVPNSILPLINAQVKQTDMSFQLAEANLRIHYVDHHLCHARFAYATSGFSKTAILVMDGWSEEKCTSWYLAEKGEIKRIKSALFPHSIGCVYAAITEFLGFRPFNDEWKVMGMAAYGNPDAFPEITQLIHLTGQGDYQINLKYFDYYVFDRKSFFSSSLTEILGPCRQPDQTLEQVHFDVAAACQRLFEHVLYHCLDYLYQATGCANVCLSGGTAMNCLANGKVVENTPFANCFVPFAPDDSGNAIGAALEIACQRGLDTRNKHLGSFLGNSSTNDEIAKKIGQYKLKGQYREDIIEVTAKLLSEGNIVGWFSGRSEFGQRALGHRSILAAPTPHSVKETLNSAIKFRESFRPFAPMIMAEHFSEYFETADAGPFLYMEKACRVSKYKQEQIAAATHADGTARVQVVNATENPRCHALLKSFKDLTGTPVLINTSFNLNGEPIVNSIDDAIRTFYSSGMDALVLEDYLITKT